ncbi:MAG: hypothetical protein SWY16_13700 [Cyanobacteriota bacterium]|nr:hypothetical protein [Cyanobacteriota bacterium]
MQDWDEKTPQRHEGRKGFFEWEMGAIGRSFELFNGDRISIERTRLSSAIIEKILIISSIFCVGIDELSSS